MKIKLISLILILCCFISVSGWAFIPPGQSDIDYQEYQEKCQSSVLEKVKCYINDPLYRFIAGCIAIVSISIFCDFFLFRDGGGFRFVQAQFQGNQGNAMPVMPVETKACGDATYLSR